MFKKDSLIEFKHDKLSNLCTLGVGAYCERIFTLDDPSQLQFIFKYIQDGRFDYTVLGEGSNVFISDNAFDDVVIINKIRGINIINECDEFVHITAGAGENWDDFVKFTTNCGFWGLENLSHIPGSVGASPVQNVGAYGQEVRNVIESITVYDCTTNEVYEILPEHCDFGFRKSIFNTSSYKRYVILKVHFKLNKNYSPILNRPEIKKAIKKLGSEQVNPGSIRNIVIAFRSNGKALPINPAYGCAGTFFKTAIVSLTMVPNIFFKTLFNLGFKMAIILLAFGWKYRSKEGFRLPSKMLIEACGLSGYRVGSAFLYQTNAAVLTTDLNSSPTSDDIVSLIKHVRSTVASLTGVVIPIEPVLLGFTNNEIDLVMSEVL